MLVTPRVGRTLLRARYRRSARGRPVRPLEAPPRDGRQQQHPTDTTSTMPRPHVELPDHGVAVPRPDLCNPDEFSVGLRHEQDAIRQSGQETLARPPQADLLLCSSRSDDRVVVGRYDHRTERSDGVEILLVCQPDHDLGFHRHPPPFSWSTTQRSRSPIALAVPGTVGAADAPPRHGTGTQPFCQDLAATGFAAAMDPGPHPLDGTLDVDQLLFGCGHERDDLCPLEGDRRAFGVMLVIA
jgi:hypothetical protein